MLSDVRNTIYVNINHALSLIIRSDTHENVFEKVGEAVPYKVLGFVSSGVRQEVFEKVKEATDEWNWE